MKKKGSNRGEEAFKPQGGNAGSEPAQAMRTKPIDEEAMLRTKEEDEPLLEDVLLRSGQQRALRRLLLSGGQYTTEAVALMTACEVCTCVQMDYAVVGVNDEGNDILLVKRDKLEEYNKLVTHILR